MRERLNQFRQEIKNNICNLLVQLYVSKYHEMPNWEEEEEIVLNTNDVGCAKIYLYFDNYGIEEDSVLEYRVTLDNNLFFVSGNNCDEIEWSELSTDDLVNIYEVINNKI
jgi:hypothetical protein